MSFTRLLMIAVLGTLLFIVLQLPDDLRTVDKGFTGLDNADFRRLAAAEWYADRRAPAVMLLNYAIDNRLPDASVCEGVRDGYLTVMQNAATPEARLALLGLDRRHEHAGGFEQLASATVADWFVSGTEYGAMEAGTGDDPALAAARQVIALFPPADPALRLLAATRRAGVLRDGLDRQVTRALNAAAQLDDTAALVTVQETVMPIFQLARQCRAWAEFATLMRHADSIDQVKLLARITSLTPLNSGKLARALIMTEADQRPDMAPLVLDHILRRGQAGMDGLDFVLRKGAAGLQYLMANPHISVDMLAREPATGWWVGPWYAWWQEWHTRHGLAATMVKSLLLALICGGIIVCLLPWRILRATPAVAEGGGTARSRFYYWLTVAIGSAAVCVLLLLGGSGTEVPEFAAGAPGAAEEAAAGEGSLRQLAAWLVILVLILSVQGTCWDVARRKIKTVSDDRQSDTALKLRRLENLEIFFDLPLYTGLAMTIFAFILIATLGTGVSRFLAYSSTFVGIIFAVALRLGYLYPLREKLINQRED